MENAEIEIGEIKKPLKALKNRKTAGTDGIIGEFLKYGGLTLKKTIHNICAKTIHNICAKVLEEEVPED